MNVIAFPRRTTSTTREGHAPEPAEGIGSVPGPCPSWCIDTTSAEHFHAGQPHLFIEHDDDQTDPLFATGARMASITGTKPVVEMLWWHRDLEGWAIDDKHLLTPDEARSIAEHLLRCAKEAERATW